MTIQTKLLIANRGEIAVRIANAAFALNIPTVSLYTEDDPQPVQRQRSDEAVLLPGRGVAAWLDMEAIIAAAQQTGCNLIHPGYGFLSENGQFARLIEQVGLTFIGADPEDLDLLGNKVQARRFAADMGIPVLPGSFQETTLEEAQNFLESIDGRGGIMLKAISGGGGRGMRAVSSSEELTLHWERATSEAERAFGDGGLYFEKLITGGRHIEVQIVGDGTGDISHLYTRDCSIQRRHQKLIEIAPAPNLDEDMAHALQVAAVELMSAIKYSGAGTVEFLVEDETFYFIESNARIQVEHTVTEEITGVDLVRFQIRQALGETLFDMGLGQPDIPPPLGMAMQCRINAEQILPPVKPEEVFSVQAATGTLTAFDMPSGRGVRVNASGYTGYTISPLYDSLLAKLIVYSPTERFSDLARLTMRQLESVTIGGVSTNLGLLKIILDNDEFGRGAFDLAFFNNLFATNHHLIEDTPPPPSPAKPPLEEPAAEFKPLPEGSVPILAPMPGSILSVDVTAGSNVMAGQTLAILEAMKMETVISAPAAGQITEVRVEAGDILMAAQVLFVIDPVEMGDGDVIVETVIDLDMIRPDLQELFDRRAIGQDTNRPQAVEKRRSKGQRTARENIFDLVDPGSFAEYGSAAIAAQRTRRSLEDLIENTPADGLVAGTASINGDLFPSHQSRAMVMSYDYTVLAGTQGAMNHKKMDRLLHLAEDRNMPLVIFAEGGGGRPGDVDVQTVAGLDVMTFALFARMSGKMPRVTIVSGYCFAGNAALAGAADVIIATENASLGMGGPAMIAGGGLGNYHPKEVGPMSFQTTNGVVDVLVKD
ncbi:MAG: biotin carboxylase N-terminal domain-containing protein [Chloroflexota bacterium]